jgi:DNA/RNA endonuclease YhcR with UshA esterase domain
MKFARREMLLALTLSVICLASLVGRSGAADEPNPISPAEAADKVNQDVLLEMKVGSATLRNGVCFLNSEENFKSDKNFTLFISREMMTKFKEAKIDDPVTHFKGKTVRVKGKVTLFRERPQIELSGPDAIAIVRTETK